MAIPKMTTDPYAVLGIPNDAAPAAIRSSYKKLILQCHPDKVHDESLREEKAIQFQKVQEAYELLIDSRRRRKYDDELVKQAKAAAEAAAKPPQPTHSTHPHSHSPHSQHPHGTRSASGPVPGSAERSERAERPARRERSGTNPSPDERQRDKEKEREARHARKRAEGRERKSREESSWSAEEQSSRKATQAEYAQWEAEEARKAAYEAHTHTRHQEEVPRKGYRYPEESPRKASYDARQYETPKPPPAAPPPPTSSEVRPGYFEAKKAEEAKLAKLKQRMAEEINIPRASAADESIRQQATQAEVLRAAAERVRLDKIEVDRRERELREREARERAEMRGSRDRDRASEVPQHRERKSSKSPPLRRGSSVTSRYDDGPSTPVMRPQVYGTSAPPHPAYSGSHPLNTGNYGAPRRRHSSPSIEKQTSRMPRGEAPMPCDSGYSSPSTDTPITDKKMPSPEIRTAAEGIDPRTGPWKRYTFEVYIREDAEAQAQATGGIPSHHARRQPGSTSPSIHPADLAGPPAPLPAEYIPKAVGAHGIPFPMYSASIDPRYAPPPSSIHPHSPPSSHPHSPHTSPPRAHRHHQHHSPSLSPRLVPEQFSPGLSRANTTTYHSHSSRSREREREREHYSGYAPSLNRGTTFPG